MSIVTEIQALSYACELDMNGTINVVTGKFFKASRDKLVRAKILCFRQLRNPDLIGSKELKFLSDFKEIRDHFFYTLDYFEVIEKFKKRNQELCQERKIILNITQSRKVLNYSIDSIMIRNGYKSKAEIIPKMFESGLFFYQDYEISAFCGGKGSRLSYGELEHICREYELRQGEPMLKDKISIANYAIAYFIDEFLQGIPLPEGIIMSEDIKNLIQVLENKKKYGI